MSQPTVNTRVRWIDNDGTLLSGTITDVYEISYYDSDPGVGVEITWDDDAVEEWPWPHIDLMVVSE